MRYLFTLIILLRFIPTYSQEIELYLDNEFDYIHNSSLDYPTDIIWVIDSSYRTVLTDNVWHLTSRIKNAQRNSNGLITEVLYDSKNKETGIWKKANKKAQYYNENLTQDSTYLYVWSTSQDSFKVYSKDLFENGNNGLPISYIRYRKQSFSSDWIPDRKFTYTYESNQIKKLLVEKYDKNLMEWEMNYINKYSYNNENLNDTTYVCIWDEDQWNLGRYYIHEYQDNSTQLTTTTIWIDNEIEFIRDEQIVYNYDENNNTSIIDNYIWNEDLGLWIKKVFTEYFWSQIEINASQSVSQTIPFTHSPNPVSNQLIINNDIWNHTSILQLYDINGKKSLDLKYESPTIDISRLNPGIYFINIINDNKLYTSKVIIN